MPQTYRLVLVFGEIEEEKLKAGYSKFAIKIYQPQV